ncbi:MAG TPA: hypothetical protein VLR49_02190 [Ferruginibacter sp.]|nr:hypothetical protein [Ferruginibacter sp.]
MQLTKLHRKQFLIFYFICFAGTYCWLVLNGLLLHQIAPVFFINKLDFSRNLLMLTDIQHAVINSYFLQVILDVVYILSALVLLASSLAQHKSQYWLAVLHSIYNFIYAMLITSVSTLSIEGYISWILIPVIFAFRSETSFYFMLHSMRYFFLMIFASAAFWKIRAGGIFNIEQMSGILLKQHTSYIFAAPNDWFSRFLSYLVVHIKLSWSLYFVATIAELLFLVGFFTKKYDRALIIIFILFLLFDYFIMRINYMSWLIFSATLWFAKYTQPATAENRAGAVKIISSHTS